MFIARQLKKENIAEYLLYMWQIENLLRACKLDIDIANEKLILTQQLSDEQRKALYDWTESLIEMMKQENLQEKGHLQLNKNIIIELNDLHHRIMRAQQDAGYAAKFYHILPLIVQLRAKQTDPDLCDIEICFNFLYGIMMLKMNKAAISKETLQAQEEISKFMALLAQNYNLYRDGQLDVDE